uniref:Nucleolar protein 8 n=1 Tax=Ciona savignyi TaxID=51511 RepID=H2Z0H6_CIOSA
MKGKKHEDSNEKRLNSLKQRREEGKKAKELIQISLKKGNTSNKHIKFDSDSETEHFNEDEKLKKKSNADNVLGFDSDDEDLNGFQIKPQFHGRDGQKLLEMQSSVGADSRFKIDDRFMVENEVLEPEDDDKTELQRNLSVLHQVVGSKAMATRKKGIQFSDPTDKRYDPSRKGHADMEVQPAKSKKAERKKKKKEKEEIPEVTKDRFYEISSNELKQAFGRNDDKTEKVENDEPNDEGNTFSLLTMLGRDPDRHDSDCDVIHSSDDNYQGYEDISEKPHKSTKFGPKVFKHDSSESEPEETEFDPNVAVRKLGVEIEEKPFSFFPTSKDDPRLTEASLLFFNDKHPNQIRQEWVEIKDKLREDYKKKHRDAVRLLRIERRQKQEV